MSRDTVIHGPERHHRLASRPPDRAAALGAVLVVRRSSGSTSISAMPGYAAAGYVALAPACSTVARSVERATTGRVRPRPRLVGRLGTSARGCAGRGHAAQGEGGVAAVGLLGRGMARWPTPAGRRRSRTTA